MVIKKRASNKIDNFKKDFKDRLFKITPTSVKQIQF